ncbi:NAD(P)/FAD-dependent oxidoreductase [Mixta intestinalis]|uniref:Gamma-glutamylputrescine oxidoreductase n=1 Tax=Mixta intestinalis TaxID=1615494 RepID=A0A6P1PZY2_9GAMM|nr:FAD-binding oxidoreductase [Mixta intestinalis]QHM72230.1 Gamma-glutamylputrescine oxidoreductase [Mixta intestinalis]
MNAIPINQNISGWLSQHPQPAQFPALTTAVDADWVVIGAGFAGLAFARRLATLHPEMKIVVLEAGTAYEGASGRNSGFIIGLPHNIGSSTAELQKAHAWRKLLQAGKARLKALVDEHHIACDWEEAGKYHCQAAVGQERILQDYCTSLEQMGESYQRLDAEALQSRLGTQFYQQGIFTPDTVLVNPALLVAGLAQTLPENVSLYYHSPAMDITCDRLATVYTPTGLVRAPKVMLATNALSAKLLPGIRRQAAMATFASLTPPLSEQQLARLPQMESWGLTPVNAIAGATLRLTADRRFLLRQYVVPALRGRVTAAQTERAIRSHHQFFNKVYPQLSDVSFSHCWSGTISVTRNGAPLWGKVNNFIYTAGGCNGAGITKQTIAGELLADFIFGEDNPLLAEMQSLGKANWLPPSPVLDIAIEAALQKERWLGRKEC